MNYDTKVLVKTVLDEDSLNSIKKQISKTKISIPISLNLKDFTKEQKELTKQANSFTNTLKNNISKIQLSKDDVGSHVLNSKDLAFGFDKNSSVNALQNYMKKNSNITKESKYQIQEWIATIQSADNLTKGSLEDINVKFSKLDHQMYSLNSHSLSFDDKIADKISKFSEWISSSDILMSGINELRNMAQSVKYIDDAMVNLSKTTNATSSQLKDFYNNSSDIAKQLGISTQDVIQSAAYWTNLGYSIQEASELAKNSSILASISPGMDIDKASSTMFSAIKAYGVEAEDTLDGIANKISIIGKNTNSSNGDISNILNGSASAMQAANTDLNKTISIGVAANIGILLAVSFAIKGVMYAWDELNTTTEEYHEIVDNTKNKLEQYKSELEEIQKDGVSDSEKEREEYLQRMIKWYDEMYKSQMKDYYASQLFGKGDFMNGGISGNNSQEFLDYSDMSTDIDNVLNKRDEINTKIANEEPSNLTKFIYGNLATFDQDQYDNQIKSSDTKLKNYKEKLENQLTTWYENRELFQTALDSGSFTGYDKTMAEQSISNLNTHIGSAESKLNKINVQLLVEQRDLSLVGKIWDGETWQDGQPTQTDIIEANTTFLVMLNG